MNHFLPLNHSVSVLMRIYCALLLSMSFAGIAVAHDPDGYVLRCDHLDNPPGKKAPKKAEVKAFPGPRENSGMSNQPIGTFDMAREIPGFVGRDFRVRFWWMAPEGEIAEHCHEDRPAFVYLLSGTVEETYMDENNQPQKRTLTEGQAVPEGNGTHHWWRNESKTEVVTMVAIDFPNKNTVVTKNAKNKLDKGVDRCFLNEMDMAKQYPHIATLAGYRLEGQRLTVEEGGSIGLRNHRDHPGIVFVKRGELLEYRSDNHGDSVVRRQNDLSLSSNGLWNYWENKTDGQAELVVIKFEKGGQRLESCTNSETN